MIQLQSLRIPAGWKNAKQPSSLIVCARCSGHDRKFEAKAISNFFWRSTAGGLRDVRAEK